MNSPAALDIKPVLAVQIQQEQDLVTARQRARQLCSLLGFNQQDQTRIATAVSEIARNAYEYAHGGRLNFSIDLRARPQFLWIQMSDKGRGIRDVDSILTGKYVSPTGMGVGLAGTSRLMDEFHIDSSPETGTVVQFGKPIPSGGKLLQMSDIGQLCTMLALQNTAGVSQELELQNRDLLQTLDTLRMREAELERRQQDLARLNLELEETNRGVVALYAELDEKAQALRRADEMKSRFLSHVSHEFRTPVSSVLALTRLLLQRVDGDLLPEQEKQVAYIRDAAQQLADMVNDLLDLAKVEAGKTEVRLTNIDVGQFLGSTRALMRPLVTNEAVSLVFEEPALPVSVESDESKLGQILRNLISNSLKFTQQGEVRVTAALAPTAEWIEFKVKDTGIGIAPEDQERIFNEFAQVENPIQRQVKGTGLGLPLSRKLATLLGGTLTVDSALGQGSTFTLSIPCGCEPRSSPSVASSQDRTDAQSILIIDNEASSRYLAQRLFAGSAHRIVEANGTDATERARFEAPVLILLDLVMPERSGFMVLDDLKSDAMTKDIPVIIHTSKVLTDADLARLSGKYLAILPKETQGRSAAFLEIRRILGEPHLFATEPEFA